MFQEPDPPVSQQMVSEGLLDAIAAGAIDEFLAGEGLLLLFFPGPNSARRESHDVAVALRELLRDYGAGLRAALVTDEPDEAQRQRLRVSATPCLTFAIGGEVLESLPRVRDWADYSAAFQRYLGTPDKVTNLMESA
jgi:hydrogenase-1 operon protein HyaE